MAVFPSAGLARSALREQTRGAAGAGAASRASRIASAAMVRLSALAPQRRREVLQTEGYLPPPPRPKTSSSAASRLIGLCVVSWCFAFAARASCHALCSCGRLIAHWFEFVLRDCVLLSRLIVVCAWRVRGARRGLRGAGAAGGGAGEQSGGRRRGERRRVG